MFGNCGVTRRWASPRARTASARPPVGSSKTCVLSAAPRSRSSFVAQAPRHGGAVGQARLADHPLLQVAQVAPVGVEVARRPVGQRGGGGAPAGGAGVGDAAQDAHPARGPRRHPERHPGLGQHGAALVEGIPVVVAPLAHGHARRGARRPGRPDPRPCHPTSASPARRARAGRAAWPPRPRSRPCASARQLPRLVEPDVDPSAGEERKQLRQQLAHERERGRDRTVRSSWAAARCRTGRRSRRGRSASGR